MPPQRRPTPRSRPPSPDLNPRRRVRFQVRDISSVESGRGLPHSKPWRISPRGERSRGSVVECASPLALLDAGRISDLPLLRTSVAFNRCPLQPPDSDSRQLSRSPQPCGSPRVQFRPKRFLIPRARTFRRRRRQGLEPRIRKGFRLRSKPMVRPG